MRESIKSIGVCLSPDLIHLYDLPGSIVVVVDILRATSCITTALAHDISAVRPVGSLSDCQALQQQGYIGAAERRGQKVDGFQLGNSPISYMNPELEGKSVALTTTNGTDAIMKSKEANQVLMGSFLNYSVLVNYLKKLPYDIIIHCAGWNGQVNMEDTIFAGAVVEELFNDCEVISDAALLAKQIYHSAKDNMYEFLEECSHVQRLLHLDLEEDIRFCLQYDKYNILPVLRDNEIVKMTLKDMLF
jgi:2-phosphosulfolactate phosphatase